MSTDISEEHAANTASASHLLHADFLLHLLFNPEDGGDMFLQNVGWLSIGYILLYPR
jgi:hypothetical protein